MIWKQDIFEIEVPELVHMICHWDGDLLCWLCYMYAVYSHAGLGKGSAHWNLADEMNIVINEQINICLIYLAYEINIWI